MNDDQKSKDATAMVMPELQIEQMKLWTLLGDPRLRAEVPTEANPPARELPSMAQRYKVG